MSKKVMGIIVAVVLVLAIVAGLIVLNMMNKNDSLNKTSKIEINLEELDEKISNTTPFDEMATMDVDEEILSTLFQIEPELVTESIGKLPMMNVQASMYLVVKASSGNVDKVKEKVDEYFKSYDELWSRYLPDQYDLVKNKKMGVKGDYVYLIICEDAEEIEAWIK